MTAHIMFSEYLKNDKEIQNKVLVEIGTTREIMTGQDSTKFFYDMSKQLGFKFVTIDMDEENSNNARSRFPGISAITMNGEDYLREYDGLIDFVYLDAFDFWHPNHSQKRKDKYKNILECEISNEACHQMHLECCSILLNKMPVGGIILFDDVLNHQYDGKGKTAIPYLLENNFKIYNLDTSLQGCLLIKQ